MTVAVEVRPVQISSSSYEVHFGKVLEFLEEQCLKRSGSSQR